MHRGSPFGAEQHGHLFRAMDEMSDAGLEECARAKFRSLRKFGNGMFVLNKHGKKVFTFFTLTDVVRDLTEADINFAAVVMIARDAEKERKKFSPLSWVNRNSHAYGVGHNALRLFEKIRPRTAAFVEELTQSSVRAEMVLGLSLAGLPVGSNARRTCRRMYPIAPPNPLEVPVSNSGHPKHYCSKCRKQVLQVQWYDHLSCHT
jgi:hypothetical protein